MFRLEKHKGCRLLGAAVVRPPIPAVTVECQLYMGWIVQRVNAAEVLVTPAEVIVSAGSWSKKLPNLVERLTCRVYDDGGPRAVGRLSWEHRDDWWCLTLTEPDAGLMIVARTETPDELLPALEGLLTAQTPPWQPCPWLKAKPPRKGKK